MTHRRLADVVDDLPGGPADDERTHEGRGDPPPVGGDTDGGRAGRWVERWLPPGSGRRTPRPRVLVSVAAGLVVAIGIVLAVVVGRPSAEEPPPLPVAHEKPAPGSSSSAPTGEAGPPEPTGTDGGAKDGSERLVVSVVGKVRDPGLVRVRAGARVADAIEAAGGARGDADLMSVNLARKLADGEQLYVGVPVPPGVDPGVPQAGASGEKSSGGGDELIRLNSADADELESLSGVGEVTAQRILDWRTEHGGFSAVEELREIDGIGDKRFEELRDQVSVE